MSRFMSCRAFTFAVATLLASIPAQAQQASTPSASATAIASPAAPALRAVHHLVYQFGYNTRAAAKGTGTGKTTIDILSIAKDGGIMVKATDDWWYSPKPRQSYTCEVYPSGGVKCSQEPFAISPIQIAVAPLLGPTYFAPLSDGANTSWKQMYKVRATFLPSGGSGFAGQVYTWDCVSTLTGKGTRLNHGHSLNLVHAEITMKQQGGRAITINQQANILFDPTIHMPVYVTQLTTFVPRLNTNSYSIEMSLIRT